MDSKKVQNSSNSIKQAARNAAEKQRRDRYNTSINDLANIVPFTPYANKRLDKISILRLSAAYLRLHLEFNFLKDRPQLKRREMIMMDKMIETLNGFMLLLNNDRKIILTSHNCFNYLGHQDIDMIGNNLDTFIHPFEIEMIQKELYQLKTELNSSSNYKSRSILLRCRMKTRIQPKSEFPNYQFVQISGYMINLESKFNQSSNQYSGSTRSHPYMRPMNSRNSSLNSSYQSSNNAAFNSTNRTKINQSFNFSHSDQNSKYLFIGCVQSVQRDPFENLTLFEALQDEYNTLWTLDCKLLKIDHRVSNIIGFLPKELINSYAHEHIHKNDQHISKLAHQMMLDSADGISKIVHRLKTKSGNYVYIASLGKLNFDKSRAPQNFVCFNRLLSDADGEKERAKLVQKFSLQSMNPHQTSEQIPFEYAIKEHSNFDQNRSSQNLINLSNQRIEFKQNQKGPIIKINSALKINNSLNNQQISKNSNESTYFKINPINSAQDSSLGFLIVNQLDASKLVVQPTLYDSSFDFSNNSSQFSTNQISHLKSDLLISKKLTTNSNQMNIAEQAVKIDQMDESTGEQFNTENSEQDSLNFLEQQCPNNGSFSSQHPVRCY